MSMNMQRSFKLLVMTPEKELYNGEATHLIVSSPEGDMGIMADHMPIISVISESVLRVEIDGTWKNAAIGQGFLDITTDVVELFVDFAEWSWDIDLERSQRALYRSQERLQGGLSHTEYLRSHGAMARATARINAAKMK